jgi:hypothetical protein
LEVVARYELRFALNPLHPNLCAESTLAPSNSSSDEGVNVPTYNYQPISNTTDLAPVPVNPSELKLPRFTPEQLLGVTFVRELDDSKSYRAKIVRRIKDKQDEDSAAIKFIVELGEVEYDEILTYNEL